MAITVKKLESLGLGTHTIGEGETMGLKLIVTRSKDGKQLNCQFVFQYKWQYPDKAKPKQHRLGLGGYPTQSLKGARELARKYRSYLNEHPKGNPALVKNREDSK